MCMVGKCFRGAYSLKQTRFGPAAGGANGPYEISDNTLSLFLLSNSPGGGRPRTDVVNKGFIPLRKGIRKASNIRSPLSAYLAHLGQRHI